MITRRSLLVVGAGAIVASPVAAIGKVMSEQEAQKPPPLKLEIVREFVGAAHANFDKMKEMLGNEPALLNATVDHKNGDFEAAIGGAGHMGNRQIALHLLEKGARMDLFVAAMLGEIEIVQATLKRFPHLKDSKGPHGISLMRHAEAGGEHSAAVLEYLKKL